MIVIDASVFVAAILEDEQNAHSQYIYDLIIKNEYEAIVPPIFYYETSNVFLQCLRRLRINETQYQRYSQILFGFKFLIDEDQSIKEVSSIAKLYGLTVYDAAYLELAIRGGYSLATLDKQLSAAALQAKVKLELNQV